MGTINLTATKTGAQNSKNVLDGITVKTNKVYVGNSNYEDAIADDSANLTVGVFFDGTLNNRENTKARIAYEKAKENSYTQPALPEEESKSNNASSFLFWKKKKQPPQKVQELSIAARNYERLLLQTPEDERGSYENDLSNIARMEPAYSETSTEKQYQTKVYIEGIATTDGAADDQKGAGFGTGPAGVPKKVEKACIQIAEKVDEILPTDIQQINFLQIDVFGFSRGAAAARNFIYEIHRQKGDPRTIFDSKDKEEKEAKKKKKYEHRFGELGEQLAAKGYGIKILVVRFAGLYETVASYGKVHYNDTKDLNLTAVKKARHTFQLVAQDEHRENFALTNIDSTGPRGVERFIPGVHSDIGGGYTNNAKEEDLIIKQKDESHVGERNANKLRDHLIQHSWYKPEDIYLNQRNAVVINRTVASNAYSFIPLHIMTEYAITQKSPLMFAIINEDYPLTETSSIIIPHPTGVPLTITTDLKSIKLRLDAHIYHGAPPMDFDNPKDQEMLRVIRSTYMHTSAHYNGKLFGIYPPHYPDGDYWSRTREVNNG